METRSRMSRSLHTNRDFEKLEPYEGKPSRTVLRGEEGSNALDLPDRPSDLQQRDGRGVRAGNEIAKHFAGNNVDVIIYAVEKSLDSYKFNLLHCKQTFISQLKSGAMGARTIDEGAMDEKSGMNFSEYMALLSGNTDLLDNAKLEKRIASLEGERKSFNKGKRDSEFKLEAKTGELRNNTAVIEAMTEDWNRFLSVVQTDKEGNRLNAVKVDGVDSTDEKVIGKRLQEIAGKVWKKEDELKQLKSELAALDRKIQLELAPPTQEADEKEKDGQEVKPVSEGVRSISPQQTDDAPQIRSPVNERNPTGNIIGDHVIIGRPGFQLKNKNRSKGIKI